MSQPEEKILSKIRKIMALAGNNPSLEESQSALLKAQALLAQHGLTMQQIDSTKPQQKNIVDEAITPKQRNVWWHKNLANIIGKNFKCYCYTNPGNNGTTINYLGLQEDVELAREVYQYAVKAVEYHYKSYLKQFQDKKTAGIKNNYIQGFLKGLKDKFTEQVNKNNWGLILVKDGAVVEAYEKKNLRKGIKSRVCMDNNKANWEAGYRQGKEFEYEKQKKMIK